MDTAMQEPSAQRLAWVDVAKGLAIMLVVLKHVVFVFHLLGLPVADLWHLLIRVTAPMRMPGFFLLSGLFAERLLARSRSYFVRNRVMSFLYLYILWAGITTLFDYFLRLSFGDAIVPVLISSLANFFLRLGTPLWYLIALPAFYLTWWLTRKLPAFLVLIPSGLLWAIKNLGLWHLDGAFDSPGFHGILNFLFFFSVGARASSLIRSGMSRMTPWAAVLIVASWAAYEFLAPFEVLKPLLAVPALFAIAWLISATWLRAGFRFAGQRSLQLYLMNWLAASFVGGVILQLKLSDSELVRLAVPAAGLLLVIGLIALIWTLTRNYLWLYSLPPAKKTRAAAKPPDDGSINPVVTFFSRPQKSR